VLGPLDAAQDHVLVWRQPGGSPELRREVVRAEVGENGHLLQTRAGVEVFLDVLDDGAELCAWERAVPLARGLARRPDVPEQMDGQEVGQRLGGERAAEAGPAATKPLRR